MMMLPFNKRIRGVLTLVTVGLILLFTFSNYYKPLSGGIENTDISSPQLLHDVTNTKADESKAEAIDSGENTDDVGPEKTQDTVETTKADDNSNTQKDTPEEDNTKDSEQKEGPLPDTKAAKAPKVIQMENDQMMIQPQDSMYAETETNNEMVDNGVVEEVIAEIKMEEQLKQNINPADPDKDWSIRIHERLGDISSESFISGDPITRDFFSQVIEMMHGNRLSFPLEQRMKMENGKTIIEPILFFSNPRERLSESKCSKLFHFPEEFIEDTTIKHKIVVDNLPDITPNFYSGSGYVIVGGEKYSWFALLVVETLRELGSTLPVEVIIPSNDEYEKTFCEEILPQYNAKCVMLQQVFNSELFDLIKITGYQYKSLALLASSFEHAFLLDSDNYPVMNPDQLFTSDLYSSHTMITWPDYWRRTTSPYFYQIRGTKIGKTVRFLNDIYTDTKYYLNPTELKGNEKFLQNMVHLHNREGTIPDWTTESGQMLINKKVHFKALLLALYYNLEGQFGFYPLLSQGGAGEGDKETFVAASNYYGLNYYQVNTVPDRAYGFYKYESLIDTSIIQYNPLRDYEILQEARRDLEQEIAEKGAKFRYDYRRHFLYKFDNSKAEPMFYHVHETKMDPFTLIEIKATEDLNGNKLRNLGGDFPRFNFDLEKFLWEKTEKHVCVDKSDMLFFKDKDRSVVCDQFIRDQLQFLEKSAKLLTATYDPTNPFSNLKKSENLVEASLLSEEYIDSAVTTE